MQIQLKRVYEPPADTDGTRILVDRLWPRGLKKADADITEWMKEIAPSADLRKWFDHDPGRWAGFQSRYRAELDAQRPLLDRLQQIARHGRLTLLFAARDTEHNNAVVLRDVLSG